MEVLLATNDPVRLSYVSALLREAGIEPIVLDEWTSSIEGSIGAIPRRLAVAADDAVQARRLLADLDATS